MSIPFKREFFTFLKLFYKPKRELVHKYLRFDGIITVKVDKDTNFTMRNLGWHLENYIFWYGLYEGYETYSIKVWIELAKKAKVIVDVGANTGLFSLVAKAVNPTATVYALEPVERVFEKLEANVDRNSYDIQCISKAASNSDGTALIYDDTRHEHTYSVTVNENFTSFSDEEVAVEIETIQLDTLVEQYKLTQIDLLKIDVEGHEPQVFEGFQKYIKQFEPNMIVEIWNSEIGEQIDALIQDIDYLFFTINESANCELGITKIDNASQTTGHNVLICKPELAESIDLLKQVNDHSNE